MNCSAMRAMFLRATRASMAAPKGTLSARSTPRSSALGTSTPSKYSARCRAMSSRSSRAGNTSTKRNSCVLKAGRDIAQSIIRSLHHDMRKTFERSPSPSSAMRGPAPACRARRQPDPSLRPYRPRGTLARCARRIAWRWRSGCVGCGDDDDGADGGGRSRCVSDTSRSRRCATSVHRSTTRSSWPGIVESSGDDTHYVDVTCASSTRRRAREIARLRVGAAVGESARWEATTYADGRRCRRARSPPPCRDGGGDPSAT